MRWNKYRNTTYQNLTQKEKSLKAKMGKCGGKGKIPAESRWGDQVPNKCVTSLCC